MCPLVTDEAAKADVRPDCVVAAVIQHAVNISHTMGTKEPAAEGAKRAMLLVPLVTQVTAASTDRCAT